MSHKMKDTYQLAGSSSDEGTSQSTDNVRRSGRQRFPSRYLQEANSQKENTSPPPKRKKQTNVHQNPVPVNFEVPTLKEEPEDDSNEDSDYVDVEDLDDDSSEHDEFSGDSQVTSPEHEASSQEASSPLNSKPSKRGHTDPNKKERERRQKESKNFIALRESLPMLKGNESVSHEEILEFTSEFITDMPRETNKLKATHRDQMHDLGMWQGLAKEIIASKGENPSSSKFAHLFDDPDCSD